MKVYKYISNTNALKNIALGNIKFSTLASLNDPTELLVKVIDKELISSLNRIRKNGYTTEDIIDLKQQENIFKILSPETMVISAPDTVEDANQIIKLPIYDNLLYIRNQMNKTVDLMSERCGIFSTSSRYNSLPMWAHYANNAKGFVVEFERLDKFFVGDNTGILNKLDNVVYKTKRSSVSFESGSYKSIFFEKDIDWKYENEKRVVTNLSSCEVMNIGNESIYIKRIPKQYISSVIFGWKINQDEIKTLMNEIKKVNSNINFKVSNVNDGLIKIIDL